MPKVMLEEARAVYAIFHVPSRTFVKLGPKVGWNNVSGSKRAMQVHFPGFRFNEQEDFIVVNLSDLYYEKHPQQGEE